MRVEQLAAAQVAAMLEGSGVRVNVGPVVVRITSRAPWLSALLCSVASRFESVEQEVADFHLDLRTARSVFRPFSRLIRVKVDGETRSGLVPAEQLPWFLDRVVQDLIAERYNCWLLLHAHVVERNGQAVLMQTADSKGASELFALLARAGQRIVSREPSVLEPGPVAFFALPDFSRELGLLEHKSLAFLPWPSFADRRGDNAEPVQVCGILILESAEQAFESAELASGEAFRRLAANSLNYEVLGETAFSAMCNLLNACRLRRLELRDFRGIVTTLNELTDAH